MLYEKNKKTATSDLNALDIALHYQWTSIQNFPIVVKLFLLPAMDSFAAAMWRTALPQHAERKERKHCG